MSNLPPLPVDKRLPLDDSTRITTFRAAESILRNDPDLARVGPKWNTWRGKQADDKSPFARGPDVCIALSLGKAPAGWFDPSTQRRMLAIDVLTEVSSPCLEDAENLWYAIERAFYPPDDPDLQPPALTRVQIRQALLDAGAETGEATFSEPDFLGEESDAGAYRFIGIGQILISVLTTLNA